MQDFPPLQCVHTFEVLARLMSYHLAIKELDIGRVEINSQIQLLERELSVRLFERAQPLTLTPDGQRFFKVATVAFDAFRKAMIEFRESQSAWRLQIRAAVTFSNCWLAPKLTEFHAGNPAVQVVLDAHADHVGLPGVSVDAEICFAPSARTDLCCDKIFRNLVTPVCAPAYLVSHPALTHGEAATLRDCTLLRTLTRPTDWPDWLRAAGISDFNLTNTLTYESSLVALRAAKRGHGIAIVTLAMVARELSVGELVAPCALTLDKGDAAYYLTYSPSKLTMPGFAAFRDWLLSQQRCT
ncbi:LysR family glycine cleavage system transcriptional activator [Paraburkholderia sp. HC6.4b]|uniref:LysR substrate-binding domain-containing protein n=1 Tax=unclassified Paraburkholderia TaxID=2615204 RepID=UPI00161EC5C8|nr:MULTISPECIES: LysR substrate-binding domain-containing protein [unclassified Paraburkholderia]MBB5413408.1 LysR family glycine cleavage system transcriptional activator [Paraburkholderia sp. HC6.4b]MBB5455689.1 LysR family glycine cleavage system transcriptional activator [Paraburkholderia sp. Kb1A]